ncbi:MAG TPA: PIG-L family deacetylase, partial [Flavisolibacter sp.]|nr:PIG-L family deacetylase [Flavisolibacter sp.]
MKKIIFLLFIFSIKVASAQPVPVITSGDIYLGLKKLSVLGSVLYIAGHPDDENTRLLTYLSKDRLYRTGYLSLTRGDGGQNLIGNEQGIELGLIRTQELLAARRIDGAEQFFTRAFDFGFSKNPEETFEKWGKEKILSDVVWVIRKFRPDVIITRFSAAGGGHGHHTASAILANEAFTAAADAKRFPEQLKWVQPWQAKRISLNSGGGSTQDANQIRLDVGGYNPVLGKSYGEIAAESRSQHKTQGFGSARTRGEAWEYFITTNGPAPQQDLMEDVNTGWSKIAGAENIEKGIQTIIRSFDFLQPQKSVPALVLLYKEMKRLSDNYWKAQKLKDIQHLIEQASGLWLDAYTTQPYVAQTDSAQITFSVNNRLGSGIKLNSIAIEKMDTMLASELALNRNLIFTKRLYIPADKPVTQPFWLEHKVEEGYYHITDQQLIGQADAQPAYKALFRISLEGEDFILERPVRYKFTDPVKGELYEPFVIVPPFTVSIPKETNVLIKGNSKDWSQSLIYTAQKTLSGVKIYQQDQLMINDTATLQKGQSKDYESAFDITLKGGSKSPVIDTFSFQYFEKPASLTAKSIHFIKYDHIPHIYYFMNAANRYVLLDVKTAGQKIGYITGAGDKVPEALTGMGYEVVLLTEKELDHTKLKSFDAIISGVRAYNTHEWLNKYHEKLKEYVEEGGNLIVQYNTSNQVGPVRAKIGPYNFNISRNRVTDENAPVTFLKPDHPVLNVPNKITTDDFKGWIQERSIYHATAIDKAFEPILSISDKGEAPENGSLIVAKHGKGYFTYTGLVFFRELPAGVPGA